MREFMLDEPRSVAGIKDALDQIDPLAGPRIARRRTPQTHHSRQYRGGPGTVRGESATFSVLDTIDTDACAPT